MQFHMARAVRHASVEAGGPSAESAYATPPVNLSLNNALRNMKQAKLARKTTGHLAKLIE
jgi:hypothetical protein